jgi:nucleoside-diphosphate-sugar epimerase
MRLLLLGGTKFFGRSIASDAIVRGHEVTLFTRGMTNPGLFGSAENVHGDRNMNLDLLKGRTFDVVIDTSGYHPRPVADAARSIDAALYCFISTISAYKDASEPGLREDSPLAELDGPLPDEFVPEQYGPLKVLCEQAVTENAAATLIVRPGLIVGPHDHTDRFTYWPVRAARGGKILVPGRPERAVQIIDVRDLAAWTLDATERGLKGTFNATGPNTELSMDEMVRACLQAAGTPSTLEWVDEAFLSRGRICRCGCRTRETPPASCAPTARPPSRRSSPAVRSSRRRATRSRGTARNATTRSPQEYRPSAKPSC